MGLTRQLTHTALNLLGKPQHPPPPQKLKLALIHITPRLKPQPHRRRHRKPGPNHRLMPPTQRWTHRRPNHLRPTTTRRQHRPPRPQNTPTQMCQVIARHILQGPHRPQNHRIHHTALHKTHTKQPHAHTRPIAWPLKKNPNPKRMQRICLETNPTHHPKASRSDNQQPSLGFAVRTRLIWDRWLC